jgi:hypothetical protein
MKVICVDNFCRDSMDDILVCENINETYGKQFVAWLNIKYSTETSPKYYKLVADDYILYTFEI